MSTPAPAAERGLRGALDDGLMLTWRYLKRIPRIPELAIFAIIQSIMFVLLFAFVFGGAIALPSGRLPVRIIAITSSSVAELAATRRWPWHSGVGSCDRSARDLGFWIRWSGF